MSRAVIRMQDSQPVASKNQPSRCFPINRRMLVKCISGNMANGSCNASMTWLRLIRSLTFAVGRSQTISTAGAMASTHDQSPQPRANAPVHESFHDDLAGKLR